METADAVVIGAGLVGVSTAYELARAGIGRIVVLERAVRPGTGSTAACTGGIRLQFSSRANSLLSLYGLTRFRAFGEELCVDISLRPSGYLFLVTIESEVERYSRGHAQLRELGIESGFVDREWIGRTAPFLELEDVVCGSHCPAEAHADPYSVLQAYLGALRGLGVRIDTGRPVAGLTVSHDAVIGVQTGKGDMQTGAVVNCAGPWAGEICRMAGVELPLVPRKRHVLAVKTPFPVDRDLPLIVDDKSGWYLKPEPGNTALIGGTDRHGTVSLDTDAEPWIVDGIIEAGIRRAPALENARVIRTIVGLRSMSPDDHALIGAVPGVRGFYCAAGFSGHGFMHAPAAGKALAELVAGAAGAPAAGSFDLTAFRPGRFAATGLAGAGSAPEPERYVF